MSSLATATVKEQRRLARLAEGAAYYGVCTKTLRRWGAEGRIRLYRVGPRALRVDLNELDALVRVVPTTGGELSA